MRCTLLYFFLLWVAVVCAQNYKDYRVYKVFIKDNDQLKLFQQIATRDRLRLLTDLGTLGNYDVVVAPEDVLRFERAVRKVNFNFTLAVANLKALLDRQRVRSNGNLEWSSYHSLRDIYRWVDNLPSRFKGLVTKYTFGYSYEGRPQKAIRISSKPGNKAIFIESNIHAIEWISSATGTCFINNLLTSKDPELRYLVENFDWIYVPVVNPDGFEYSHNVDRYWRKNRRPTDFSVDSEACYGTDLNRNFDYHFLDAGDNITDPCYHFYAGAKPNSEPEIQNLQSFFESFPKDYIRMYLALHSFGNYLLLPYGHSDLEFPPNYEQMLRISKGFADAAIVKYGTVFKYGASGLLLYPVSGSSKDWAYGVKGVPYTATLELRDTSDGDYGFYLPSEQIKEVCAEITDGFIGLIRAAEEEQIFEDKKEGDKGDAEVGDKEDDIEEGNGEGDVDNEEEDKGGETEGDKDGNEEVDKEGDNEGNKEGDEEVDKEEDKEEEKGVENVDNKEEENGGETEADQGEQNADDNEGETEGEKGNDEVNDEVDVENGEK